MLGKFDRVVFCDFISVVLQTPRTEWVLQWPGQVVIAGCQTHWTKEVSEALIENKIDALYKALMAQVSYCTCAFGVPVLYLIYDHRLTTQLFGPL